jgi:hypothetical protein
MRSIGGKECLRLRGRRQNQRTGLRPR